MELLFFYVEDFRGLREQGFNFSSKLFFFIEEGKPKGNTKSYDLTIDLNREYVGLFDEHILNVTGIIGKNGSGKSTLLHCLKLFAGQLQLLTSSLIFCLLDTEKKVINTYYYHGGGVNTMAVLNVKVEVASSVTNQYEVAKPIPYTITRMGIDSSAVKNLNFDFKNIFTCFYSNVFDSHPEQFYEGIHNISTNNKVEVFFKKYLNEQIEKPAKSNKGKEVVIWPSHIAEFHKQERKIILQFLAYASQRKLDRIPDLPQRLVVRFNFDDYEFIITDRRLSRHVDVKQLKTLHQLSAELLHHSNNLKQNFEWLTLLCTFYYVLRWYNPEVKGLFENVLDETIERMVNQPDKLFEAIRTLLGNINTTSIDSSKMDIVKQILSRRFTASLKSMKFITEEYTSLTKTRFDVQIDTGLWPVLAVIHDLASFETSSFLDYEWYGGISTGEEAILLHSARLFEIKNKVKQRPIWLFIDEGDIYFHPERQKMYLNHLLDVIRLLFRNKKIQIILTTHSPFIVSDLPKQNLIFMEKVNQKCIVKKDKLATNTFGANIHDLYNESFFIEGALIGDFAKDKIEEAIKWCQKEGGPDRAEEMRMLINSIGEPIIKMKLIEMFAKKAGQDTELARLEAQGEYIRTRIEQIKGNG